jgi:hypothetical protein
MSTPPAYRLSFFCSLPADRAKRQVKELQAHIAAAKAAQALDDVLSRRPAGSASIRGALGHAETAAGGISGGSTTTTAAAAGAVTGSGSGGGSGAAGGGGGGAQGAAAFLEVLVPRIQVRSLGWRRGGEARNDVPLQHLQGGQASFQLGDGWRVAVAPRHPLGSPKSPGG